MSPQTTRRPPAHARPASRASSRAAALLLSLLLPLTIAACASTSQSAATPQDDAPLANALTALAERQAERPTRDTLDAPPPPALDAAPLTAPLENEPRARLPLEDALANVAPDLEGENAAAPSTSLDFSDQAMRSYVRGRLRLLDGEPADAVVDLEAAAQRDPSAAAPWRTLGETHLARGDRLAAMAAFRRAVDRNPEDVHSLVRLGLAAFDQQDAEETTRLLARAWPLIDRGDPALPHVVGLPLGESLIRLGYLRAGAEAMQRSLATLTTADRSAAWGAQLAEAFRRSGEAWRLAGDVWFRLDEPERALEAWTQAASRPLLDPGAITPRRVFAAMRLGRPAEAARIIFADIQQAGGRATDRHEALIQYIARNTNLGDELADALLEYDRSLDPTARAAVGGSLARARALALPDQQARATLRARLAESPADVETLEALLDRLGDADPRDLLTETIRLTESAPFAVERFGAAALRAAGDAESLLQAFDLLPRAVAARPASVMLHAWLLAENARFGRAEALLRERLAEAPDDAAARIQLARTLVDAGRDASALSALERLPDSPDPALTLARVEVLASLGRPAEALDALQPLLDETPAALDRAAVAFMASQLHAALERWSEAERWLREVVRADPTREAAYRGLIELYAQSGPLADAEKLADVVRALRRSVPSSRTLRWLRAGELARSGRTQQAEAELRALLDESLGQSEAELLIDILINTDQAEEAEQWIRDRLRANPNLPWLEHQLARTLVQQGRGAEAESILRELVRRRPGESRHARLLEQLLRDVLNRPDEADRLTLDRLEQDPPSVPRNTQLIELYLRLERPQDAADAAVEVYNVIENPAALTDQQEAVLARVAFLFAQRAAQDAIDPAMALPVVAAAAQTLDPAPVAVHGQRLLLLTRTDADYARLVQAAEHAAQQHPQQSADVFLGGVQVLFDAERIRDAARLAEHGFERGVRDIRVDTAWVQLALQTLDPESIRRVIDTMVRRRDVVAVAEQIFNQGFARPSEASSAIAFLAAIRLANAGREDEADDLYRYTLRLDPRHAMAANNLGYRLLEEGGDPEEAASLIELAYRENPADAAIVDSYAWLRYKQGRLEDEPREGLPPLPGAVSLLEHAAELDAEASERTPNRLPDPTVRDHLGDALWRVGRTEDAIREWTLARSLIDARRSQQSELDAYHAGLLERVRAKLSAVENGEEPPLAPMFEQKQPAAEGGN